MVSEPAFDQKLISGILSGDQNSLAQLYDRHIRLLWSLVLRIVKTKDEAEEVIQDLFIRVWQRASSFDPKRGEVKVWLCQMARSMAIDRLRANLSRSTRELTYGTEQEAEKMSQPSTIELEIDWSKVSQAVQNLPPEERVLIELAYFEGLSQSQIAEKIGLPLGTVKTRIRQAMLKLKEQFKPKLG